MYSLKASSRSEKEEQTDPSITLLNSIRTVAFSHHPRKVLLYSRDDRGNFLLYGELFTARALQPIFFGIGRIVNLNTEIVIKIGVSLLAPHQVCQCLTRTFYSDVCETVLECSLTDDSVHSTLRRVQHETVVSS
jgi:hypothetical protein